MSNRKAVERDFDRTVDRLNDVKEKVSGGPMALFIVPAYFAALILIEAYFGIKYLAAWRKDRRQATER